MSNCIKIRHTQGAKDRLEQAHQLMNITNKRADSLQELFNAWSKIYLTDRQTTKLIQLAMEPNQEAIKLIKANKSSELSTNFGNVCTEVNRFARVDSTETTKTTIYRLRAVPG
jgi:uncharacterized protein with PhoU and TrkA domain